MAVGTSAIPIAVNLANRIKCSVTFTVSRIKIQKKDVSDELPSPSNPEYYPAEIIPTVDTDSNLLIIDDIISGGSVAKEIIDLLYSENMKPKKIFHFSVLG